MSVTPIASGVGRFTALVLGLVVFVCVAMIGGTGYLKYKLDQTGTILAAPETVSGSSEDVYAKLRAAWGYSGFLGFAQKFASQRDASGFPEAKEGLRAADEIIAKLPDGMPESAKRELATMASLFDSVLQKIDTPAGPSQNELSTADLAPLYAALPLLDARAGASGAQARIEAQKDAQFWSMLLTLAAWGSLIGASACVVGIYLVLRDKRSLPLHSLAQSIQNMAHGDMRTAIWGIERQDSIGDVARAVDMARYQFSHLPDISLLSEQGPVRLRFEGGSRSLFEAMMKALSTDSDHIRQLSLSLSASIAQQKDGIASLTSRVEKLLSDILQRGQTGDNQIKMAISEMVSSAESLKNTHAHTADQLNRLIPHLQERAKSLSDITQATGKQLAHTLQSLTSSEIGLRNNAEQAKTTLVKLSSTADDLGERLFGAINLLQAGGKVLAETTENIKSRWNEASSGLPVQENSLAPMRERLEHISEALEYLHTKLDAPPQETGTREAPVVSLEPVAAQIEPIKGQLTQIMGLLSALQAKMDETPAAALPRSEGGELVMQDSISLSPMLGDLSAKIADLQADILRLAPKDELAHLNQKLAELSELNAKACVFASAIPGDLRQALKETTETLAAKDDIAGLVESLKSASGGGSSPELLRQIGEMGLNLASQVETSHARIDNTIRQEVISRLADFDRLLRAAQSAAEAAKEEIQKPREQQTLALPPELKDKLLDQWFQVSAQIEATRGSVIDALQTQASRLEGSLAHRPTATPDYALQAQIEKQTQILSELVGTLALLDSDMQRMKSEGR